MSEAHVVELVSWRGNAGVSDQDMIEAVEGILSDLKTLPGFISQKLYKDDDGQWVALYIWATREEGVASNDLMALKASFVHLMGLIDVQSVKIEFLTLP